MDYFVSCLLSLEVQCRWSERSLERGIPVLVGYRTICHEYIYLIRALHLLLSKFVSSVVFPRLCSSRHELHVYYCDRRCLFWHQPLLAVFITLMRFGRVGCDAEIINHLADLLTFYFNSGLCLDCSTWLLVHDLFLYLGIHFCLR